MNNVLKFDPEKRRKPEPEEKKPQVNNGAKFVWLSALLGPIGSALLLMLMFGFSDLWQAITNPLVFGYWSQIGRLMGIAFIIGVAAAPFSLVFLGPYAMAVNKGYVLLQSIFVKRATIAGGVFGFAVVVGFTAFAYSNGQEILVAELAMSMVLAVIAGVAAAFIWANVCWIVGGGWKLAPQTNDNR